MSNIYITEPPTNGKVLLKTSLGDIDVELWSKEAPLASRNFVQLCMEGYYDDTIFHRVIQDFIAQGGDPTGTGEGGDSIYGKPFKDEFHQRLKFSRRGLVAMANGGPNDNSSQFFFTLGRTDELNKKNTIFGKVTGNTQYNLVKFNELSTDKSDRPIDLVKIFRTEILSNPFDDIVPRENRRRIEKRTKEKQKSQSKATKDFGLLSFGDEAEEEEEEIVKSSNKIISSHDVLTEDPTLVKDVAVTDTELSKLRRKRTNDERSDSDSKKGKVDMQNEVADAYIDEDELEKANRVETLKQKSKQLQKELKQARKQKEEDEARAKEKEALLPNAVKELRKERMQYELKSSKYPRAKKQREAITLEKLASFKSRLSSLRQQRKEDKEHEGNEQDDEVTPVDQDETEDNDTPITKDWISHQVQFDSERLAAAKDAMQTNTEDFYDIYDPRNPLNVRRREQQNIKQTKPKN